MKIVVFDFDKTLTYRDSLTQFFLERMKGWRVIFLPYYILLKVLSKYGVISVQKEKEFAFNVLCPRSEACTNRLLIDFADRIVLNEINEKVDDSLLRGDRVVILSASSEVYLNKIYPDCEIIGLRYDADKGYHITQHPYGKEKLDLLLRKEIERVDEFYYDSKSDEYVLPICKKAYRISNGKIVEEKENLK